MFVDASAIIALLADEPGAERISSTLADAPARITSPVAVLEAVMGLARPDKFNRGQAAVQPIVLDFLELRDIEIRDLPPAPVAVDLAVGAANRYGSGRRRLNHGDCLHYACARHYAVPILATDDEFRQTDLDVVP